MLITTAARVLPLAAPLSLVPSTGVDQPADKDWQQFDQHQSAAARLDFAEEARTLLEVARSALAICLLGTNTTSPSS